MTTAKKIKGMTNSEYQKATKARLKWHNDFANKLGSRGWAGLLTKIELDLMYDVIDILADGWLDDSSGNHETRSVFINRLSDALGKDEWNKIVKARREAIQKRDNGTEFEYPTPS